MHLFVHTEIQQFQTSESAFRTIHLKFGTRVTTPGRNSLGSQAGNGSLSHGKTCKFFKILAVIKKITFSENFDPIHFRGPTPVTTKLKIENNSQI
jgi:hypothetical protein